MKKHLLLVGISVCAVLLLARCNAWKAFETDSTDLDKVELGEECLRNNDFACAVAAYTGITDTTLRAEKLCAVRLSQGGFGITELVDVLIDNAGSTTVLGSLAKSLVKWTQARQDAVDQAVVQCSAFRAAAPSSKLTRALLLKALSSFVHCATLVAKTDVFRTEDGTNCTVPGPNDGNITANSVTDDAGTGTVSAGHAGMCNVDVAACVQDFTDLTADASSLGAKLPDISTAYDNIPANLKNGAIAADAGRLALRGAL